VPHDCTDGDSDVSGVLSRLHSHNDSTRLTPKGNGSVAIAQNGVFCAIIHPFR